MRKTSNIEHRTPNTEFVLVLVLVLVLGNASGAELSAVSEAAQPIAEGVPQVAAVRLEALLQNKLGQEERRAALQKLGEALVAAGEYEKALVHLDKPELRDLPPTTFLRAQALAGLERWSEALPLYRAAVAANISRGEALFGAGEALRALGRTDEALQTYSALDGDQTWETRAHSRLAELLLARNDPIGARRALDAVEAKSLTDRQQRRFLRAAIQLKLGNAPRASDLFAALLKNPQGASESVLLATLCAIAEAHVQAGTPDAGDDYLEDFVEKHPSSTILPPVFAKLDQLYAAQKRQGRHDLGRWSHDNVQPRRALAQWYLARAELRLGRRDNALQSFEQLRRDSPAVPAIAAAHLEYARLLFEEERFDDAIAALDAGRALRPAPEVLEQIDLFAARVQYAASRFDQAAHSFQKVAHQSSRNAQNAAFNATLAWLAAGDGAQAAAASREAKERGADQTTQGELALEEGLAQAGRVDPGAAQTLQKFIRDFPKHPRASEAWVALAELAFHAVPPRLDEARQDLQRAAEASPTAAAQERSDYLMIWLEDAASSPNENKVIELATQFLQKHAGSSTGGDVRLKLAETFFRRQDFASAQTQFALLAQQDPNGPIAEKALFFAAQSAAKTMGPESIDSALKLFDQVVRRNGELKWAARNEQAVIERRLGKSTDALTLYDEVLKGDARPVDKREALCGKADILFELGATEPENYSRAIEFYDQLATQSEVASHWRNQALFKKGVCLEKLNKPADALTTFYQIVDDGSRPDRRREFFWFYKAGFNAARLLEEQSNWKPAAAIYEKLAFAGGARSEEAKSRLNRLRLEHFLWEQ